jgi:arginyl-tRNA synthetase
METELQQSLRTNLSVFISRILDVEFNASEIRLDNSPAEVAGDLAFGCFPLAKLARRAPQQIAADLAGACDRDTLPGVLEVRADGGYLNLTLDLSVWLPATISHLMTTERLEQGSAPGQKIVIEYSSPNTNKPQHLGHVRNNVLGQTLADLLAAVGHDVTRVNLINDRGIHICKSMLTWIKLGNGETPTSTGEKGDHLVGRYYVRFTEELNREREQYFAAENINLRDFDEESAAAAEQAFLSQSSWQKEAESMLERWENGDTEIRDIWHTMNGWVYTGFDETYNRYGISFDRTYYESDTYLQGRSDVNRAMEQNLVERREDGSVWINLNEDDLEDKLLLRSNGTSVYMTQDIGTAVLRYQDYSFDQQLYVVGNEQRYHFRVLKVILQHLGHDWADRLEHVAYGMVNLPAGKLKSREGTAVDADDLLESVKSAARKVMESSNRRQDFSEEEADSVAGDLALGAIKYYLLRVSANQDLLYDPTTSVDLNGTTGPYLQYALSRMTSLLNKADYHYSPDLNFTVDSDVERELMLKLLEYSAVVVLAAEQRNPSRLAHYLYELARQFNRFWHDLPVLKAEAEIRQQRLALTAASHIVLKRGLNLLGIPTPERI